MACWYLDRGGSEAALRNELSRCIDVGEEKCQREKQQLGAAAEALEQAERSLEIGATALGAVVVVVAAVALVARFVPAARPAGLVLGRIEPQLAAAQASVAASIQVARIMAAAIRSTLRVP